MNAVPPSAAEPQPIISNPIVRPDDPRYAELIDRGIYRRGVGRPDYVRLVGSTQQVVAAVQEAVRAGLRLVVRSGGHCLEGFVADPAVRVIIDTSLMTGVEYDPAMRAIVVWAGTTLGELYQRLFLRWGRVLPAGVSPELGAGGHLLGGAFGHLCRHYGLAADHLYAVEVVVVEADGAARSVVATREPDDPNHDLWWAHTGGGGGNFGIVTRYWLRSPGATGDDPAGLLPAAPASVLRFKTGWNWADLDEARFIRLVGNYGDWCERHSAAGDPAAQLYSTFLIRRPQFGRLELTGLATSGPQAEAQLSEHLAALSAGVGAPPTPELDRPSWLGFALFPFPDLIKTGTPSGFFKIKDAFLRRRLSDAQVALAHQHLTDPANDGVFGLLGMVTYGGQTNAVAPAATASAERSSIASLSCTAGWGNPADEARSVRWVRELYRALFADTGGVPVPGDHYGGAMINHPDADLADPAWNTSGVPWSTLYYQGNYPRLQQVKARWDPRNEFHHALSIRAG